MGLPERTAPSASRRSRARRQSASPELTTAAPAPLARQLPDPGLVRKEHATVEAKRVFDVVASLTLIVLLLPLMALIAVLVCLDSRGPALFSQRRLGVGLKTFSVLKFRTMYTGVSAELHQRYIAELARGEQTRRAAGSRSSRAIPASRGWERSCAS